MIPRGQPQLSSDYFLNAPIMGVNSVDSLGAMQPSDALYLYNMIPASLGLKVRPGYKEWVTAIAGTGGVRTIIPVKGAKIDGSEDKLLAITPNGIYNATATANNPSVMSSFGTTTGLAGWASWTYFVTTAGQYICVCDEVNGYRYMDVATGTWTTPTAGAGAGQINGATPGNFDFVVAHKGRLIFVERDTAIAWVLPVGQLTGTVTRFDFGNKFARGGYLVGLYTYTNDGGAGPDDYLVAVGSGGDVIVYAGTDPTDATKWNLVGNWFVGEMPAGRRVVGSFGSDLILLSIYGAIYLSKLMGGADIGDPESYITRKIAPLINADMATLRTTRGWEVKSFPRDSLILISVPEVSGSPNRQYVLNVNTGGWAIYRGLPYQTAAVLGGTVYIGYSNGTVYKHEGTLDNVPRTSSDGSYIEFSLLTSFQGIGAPAKLKIVDFMRPYFRSTIPVSYEITARFDYEDYQEYGGIALLGPTVALWDAGTWDSAVWAGTGVQKDITGPTGMGTKVAIALRGSTRGETTLVGFDVSARQGGFM